MFVRKTLSILVIAVGSVTHAAGEQWRPLLNESLSGWEKWLGRPHASVQGLPADLPLEADGKRKAPLGLDNDPKQVFTVTMDEGEPVLHITGEIWGGLTTRESFSNFHLRTQIKWGDARWEPRKETVRDNGILYHCNGPHGVAGGNWKQSLEFQVQEKDMGDFWQVGGTRAEIRASLIDGKYCFDPKADWLHFGQPDPERQPALKPSAAHLPGDFEKPHGEWNNLDLYVIGSDAIHVVNGTVVLALKNSSAIDRGSKAETPLTAGQLQIQSESAECFYRRLEIAPLEEFPADLKVAAGL